MRDPFVIWGPAILGVSGGRTSGKMLRRILDAHGGHLPTDVVPVFANTGLERPETLDFVDRAANIVFVGEPGVGKTGKIGRAHV